jgi:hypothetical protein
LANDGADLQSQVDLVFLFSNRAALWHSQMPDTIAKSNLEAEYIACFKGSCETKGLLQIHPDMHRKGASPLPVNCDNQSALRHITPGIIKARTKQIGVCYHNTRDLHAHKIIDFSYVHTKENVADILTMTLTKIQYKKFPKAMGLW